MALNIAIDRNPAGDERECSGFRPRVSRHRPDDRVVRSTYEAAPTAFGNGAKGGVQALALGFGDAANLGARLMKTIGVVFGQTSPPSGVNLVERRAGWHP